MAAGEARTDAVGLEIAKWLAEKKLDGAVWTALPPRDRNGAERAMAPEEAVEYVMSLHGETQSMAMEYVKNAPKQIDTPIRRVLEKLRVG